MTLRVHISDDTIETNNSDELEAAEQFELLCCLLVQKDAGHGVKWDRREEVDHETALEVLDCNGLLVTHDLTVVTDNCSAENHDNVDKEEEVNDGVERTILRGLHELRLEG